jgi:hypothetical protein
MTTLTNEELKAIITEQLPRLLAEEPNLRIPLYHLFLESFADKEELGRLQQEFAEFRVEVRGNFKAVDKRFEKLDHNLEDFRTETRARFDQVDQRFEQVDQRADRIERTIAEGFKNMERQIDRLGQRWGIRNESLFRATMADLLEKSFGVKVERRSIAGEEFDVIISNGDHILVEITASARRNMQERLERKRNLYIAETGVTPARFILAIASIHSRQAQALREAGFTVIEPEEEDLAEKID